MEFFITGGLSMNNELWIHGLFNFLSSLAGGVIGGVVSYNIAKLTFRMTKEKNLEDQITVFLYHVNDECKKIVKIHDEILKLNQEKLDHDSYKEKSKEIITKNELKVINLRKDLKENRSKINTYYKDNIGVINGFEKIVEKIESFENEQALVRESADKDKDHFNVWVTECYNDVVSAVNELSNDKLVKSCFKDTIFK